ncbi:branched-chain amino acid ABC transporter permease [Oscillibacter sp.]|uniref:branched-chain amino acid ABC transporter permease n=1 Tax=Oscillibacter sp. TaxID=1945593 RepID=UPI0028B247DC|nr:branched-chain amino acid ABC transporter permease [Oscillibacter sp.]
MYINAETINDLARLLGSLMMIGGAVLSIYKFIERDRTQSKTIRAIQTEQTLLCYGIKACLQGLCGAGL